MIEGMHYQDTEIISDNALTSQNVNSIMAFEFQLIDVINAAQQLVHPHSGAWVQ